MRLGRTVSCGCFRSEIAPKIGRKRAALRRRDALRDGVPVELSEEFTRAKLSPDQVLAIRLEYAKGGITHKQLEAKYGVSDTAICALLRQQSYRYVGGPPAPSKYKLTESAVRAIRQEFPKGGVSYRELADRYGVSAAAVKAVVYGKNWRHVR